MNTQQILDTIKKHDDAKIFMGVYAIDQLPSKIEYPCCMIVNTDPSTEKGEHWLAIYFDSYKNAEFFDSFGYDPKFYKLTNFFKDKCFECTFNNIRIQSLFSDFCGHYSCLYILYKLKKKPLSKLLKNFSFNLLQNDFIIQKLINKLC